MPMPASSKRLFSWPDRGSACIGTPRIGPEFTLFLVLLPGQHPETPTYSQVRGPGGRSCASQGGGLPAPAAVGPNQPKGGIEWEIGTCLGPIRPLRAKTGSLDIQPRSARFLIQRCAGPSRAALPGRSHPSFPFDAGFGFELGLWPGGSKRGGPQRPAPPEPSRTTSARLWRRRPRASPSPRLPALW